MSCKIEKISVERVFNLGNYQTIRFGMEVSVEDRTTKDIKMCYDAALTAIEKSFNDIMLERKQQQNQ